MTLIQFVSNYEDLSTDRGYQFKFYCDKCGNGYMSRFQQSTIGTAGAVLRTVGDFLGGWASTAGHSTYDIQRSVGGKAHDDALKAAVEEGKQHFHQCSRCGRWVCPEVCWNASAAQCEECAPDYEEELSSAHATAKTDAMREQMHERARGTDYVSKIDMSAGSHVRAPSRETPTGRENVSAVPASCTSCGTEVGKAKFCPECGTPARPVQLTCQGCGHQPEGSPKFCPECGGKF
jgi:hypothetical protein